LREAQDTPSRAFKAAANAFQDGIYEIAQERFTMFIAIYPQSPMLPEAILLQARSALARTNLAPAIDLLTTNLAKAGPLSELYRYYLGTAQLQAGNYPAAVQSFSQLTRDVTNSVFPLLEASHGEAQARFKMRDFPRVSAMLSNPDGSFQRAARSQPNNVLTIRGKLLLAESLLEERKFAEAERVTRDWPKRTLARSFRGTANICSAAFSWRINGLSSSGPNHELVRAATATTRRRLMADSIALQAGVLERMDRLDEAASAIRTTSLTPCRSKAANWPSCASSRSSSRRIAPEATRILEDFLAQYPGIAVRMWPC
jgi:outer membrane protein assembly factor BamD (BamD/ComL family)